MPRGQQQPQPQQQQQQQPPPSHPSIRTYQSMQQPMSNSVYNMPMDSYGYEHKQSQHMPPSQAPMGQTPSSSYQQSMEGNPRNLYPITSTSNPSNDPYRRQSIPSSSMRMPITNPNEIPLHSGSGIDMRGYQSNGSYHHHRNKIHPSMQEQSLGNHPNVYQDPMTMQNMPSSRPSPSGEQYKMMSQPSSPPIQNFNQMSPVSPSSLQDSRQFQQQQQQQQQSIRLKESTKKKPTTSTSTTTVKKLKIKKEVPKGTSNTSPKNNNGNTSQVSTPQTPSSDLSSVGMEYGTDDYSSGWSNQSKSTTIYPYTPSSYSKEYSINSPDPVSTKIHTSYNNGMDTEPMNGQQNMKKRKSPEYTEDLIENQKNNIMNFLDSDNPLMDSAFDDLIDTFDEDVNKLQTISEIKVLQSKDDCKIICCNFNHTGDLLATGTSSTIHIWDTKEGILNSTLAINFNVTSVCFSPLRDNLLASSSLEGCIRLWNLNENGIEIPNSMKLFRSNEHGPIHSVDFHPFKENLICSSESSGYLRLWDIDREEVVQCIKDAATKQARFSSKGNMLATNASNVIKVFDTETSQLLYDITGHIKPIQSIYWTDNDSTLISASEDSVKVWKLTSNAECIGSFSQPGNKKYYAVPHPRYTESQVIVGAYMSMFVWDYSMFKQTNNNSHTEIKAHDGIVSSLSTFGTSLLASTSHDSTAKLWSVES